MKPLACPHIPHTPVAGMVVSGQLPAESSITLKKMGIRCLSTIGIPTLEGALAFHPDMQLMHLSEGVVVGAPNLDTSFITSLREWGMEVHFGERIPSAPYPWDIPYNAAIIGHLAVLHVKYADPVVIRWLEKTGKKLIPVKQGYAKCSIAIVNSEAIITADAGIAGALEGAGLDVLKITPATSILLPGFSHGFIGGACGLISENEMVFSGSLEVFEEGEVIAEFLSKHGVRPISLSESPLLDVGSFVPLTSV